MAALIAHIASVAHTYLIERAVIEREVVTTDALGSTLRTWQIVTADAPCRVIRAGLSRADAHTQTGGVEALPETYRISFAAGTSIGADCRVKIGAHTYAVVGVEAALSNIVFVTVTAVRRD